MTNLKDIRIRISSVKTTRQVTSAMKMVSAAKFKKSHDQIIAFRQYADGLKYILSTVNTSDDLELNGFSRKGDINRILLVVVTSNRGLCGAFNTNVIKQTERMLNDEFKAYTKSKSIDIIAIGKQGYKTLLSHGYNVIAEYNDVLGDMRYSNCAMIADKIMKSFMNKEYDKVLVIHNEFVNAAVQNVNVQQFLPIEMELGKQDLDIPFIFEPSANEVLKMLIPKTLKSSLYRWMLESVASEHGARMTSMHKATDNATDMITELQLVYNKARQTAITNEILEIVSGAEALSGS